MTEWMERWMSEIVNGWIDRGMDGKLENYILWTQCIILFSGGMRIGKLDLSDCGMQVVILRDVIPNGNTLSVVS